MWVGVQMCICYVHLELKNNGGRGAGEGTDHNSNVAPCCCLSDSQPHVPSPQDPIAPGPVAPVVAPVALWAPGPHSPRPQDPQHPKTPRHNTPGQAKTPRLGPQRPRKFWISSLGLPLELPLIPPNINFERVASISNLFKWMTLTL